MTDSSSTSAGTHPACQNGADQRPLCPTRRAVLERALALGAVSLLGVDTRAAGTAPVWASAGPKSSFVLNKPVLLHFVHGSVALFVVKISATQYVALSALCTHEGVQLTWKPSHPTFYHCPKHGAQFARNTGKVTHGPARQNLTPLATRVVKGVVQVDLSKTGAV